MSRKFVAKKQWKLKSIYYLLFGLIGYGYLELIDLDTNFYYVHFVAVIPLAIVALKFTDTIATTFKIQINKASISFIMADRSKKFSPKIRETIRFNNIKGLDYDDDYLYIETESKVYKLSCIAMIDKVSKREVDSCEIYSAIKDVSKVTASVDKGKINIFDRDII